MLLPIRYTPLRSNVLRHRCLSTAKPEPTADHSIYVSHSTNPYFNLSFEDWLFRHKKHTEPLVFLYRNDPCVVVGRNQNPWKEVNMVALKQKGIPFIRRRSGGGTVYHDWGNTNFSIHLHRPSFDRHATAELVRRAINTLGIDARVNDRNDICVGPNKMSSSFVSGSAYKIVNQRAYHHGTMLISTRLDTLGALLHSDKETMITKGVHSVRSPVCNLQQFSPTLSHEAFVDAVVKEYREEYHTDEPVQMIDHDDRTNDIEYIQKGMAELASWDWAYGQTPEFTYTVQKAFVWGTLNAEIRSKHGIILSCSLTCGQYTEPALEEALRELARRLQGQKYGFVDEHVVGTMLRQDDHCKDTWDWLRAVMDS